MKTHDQSSIWLLICFTDKTKMKMNESPFQFAAANVKNGLTENTGGWYRAACIPIITSNVFSTLTRDEVPNPGTKSAPATSQILVQNASSWQIGFKTNGNLVSHEPFVRWAKKLILHPGPSIPYIRSGVWTKPTSCPRDTAGGPCGDTH